MLAELLMWEMKSGLSSNKPKKKTVRMKKGRNQAVELQKMYLKTLLLAAIRHKTEKNRRNITTIANCEEIERERGGKKSEKQS